MFLNSFYEASNSLMPKPGEEYKNKNKKKKTNPPQKTTTIDEYPEYRCENFSK